MKKIIALFSVIAFVYSCGVKQTQSMISEGDYDGAINRAIEGLSNNKNAKGKQDYVYLLEEAFAKAKERDLRTIDLLIKDANPSKLEKLYNTYLQLNNRQERIRPLLPLQLLKEKRNALFPFDDYSDQIISSKNALAKHLYNNSKALLATNDKMNFRRAYDDFAYLETLSPGFKDVKKLMDEAQFKGTDFVNVYTKNETNMVIPVGLQNDLLDFSTLGLNDKWTVYHSNRQKGVTYDFGLIVNFRDIKITPEQIKEKQFIKEKQIKDGVKNLLDANGRVVRDSLGKPIKVDNFRTIKINIYEFTQFKACQITAKVDYIDFKTNQLIETFPLSSEFVFQNIYANYNGDRRASDENYYQYFDRKAVPFPSNEQMVFDTGEDLKSKLKNIITRNKFRK
ncbi:MULTISPECIES: hypothetical protein [Flavobacterium]|uniref:hypothetical protein n=1 Tax=Flavobacterium TaxID=237 RepID=UPI00086BA323|nr:MULTISPECIES: hypothetical protein [Flavobacterium]MBN9284234.1 hypothetical protein [Flavobacterium sp.]ODS80457.1 MAG: hypothetical protein ABS44_20435 [Chryseobacterium sp. SCN 40-13]OJV70685.1 MAG: hypothetical protein BGO42_14300 [Flavobacterium sp. 40-81]